MEPADARLDAGVVLLSVLQEPGEHAVVIAQHHAPIAALSDALHDTVDHAPAVGAAIHQIAQKNHPRVAPAVGFDPRQGLVEHVDLAVNVADHVLGRGGHAGLLPVVGPDLAQPRGAVHPARPP